MVGPGHTSCTPMPVSDPEERAEVIEAMKRVLWEQAIDRSAHIVTYCTIGNRASQVWYALTVLLGYPNVRVYYGSWVEWGLDPESTIDT